MTGLKPVVTPAGAGDVNRAFGLPRRFVVPSESVDDAFCVFEEDVPPGSGPPLHIHHKEHEYFFVREGLIRFHCEGETLEMQAGGTVVIPPGARHAFKNVGDDVARIIVTLTPGGGDRFFREVERLGLGPADKVEIDALAQKFSLEFVGPPID